MFAFINDKRKLHYIRKQWREKNSHNDTLPMNCFDINCVEVGKKTYGGLKVYNYNIGEKIKIGSFCSIAEDVMFILNADHHVSYLSTYPYRVKVVKDVSYEATSKGDIIIDDDVWIGYKATILSGVHIGQGAVVAAGAVVSKDVEPYSIVGGVPAKKIKKRFSDTVIDYMMTLDYDKLSDELINSRVDDLYKDIDGLDLNEIRALFEWFPKKI